MYGGARPSGSGLASAVFTFYLDKLLVKPLIDVRLAENACRAVARSATKAVS